MPMHKEFDINQFKLFWPPLGGSWFYDRFEGFTIQASGFAGGLVTLDKKHGAW